jgi:primosomal protein N' (replication factor Y)
MIAKGHDFPRVTLVGVVDADVGLGLPDFRAAERTFQLLTQVAGRAGRGPRGGEVLVQTALPGHYAIRAALEHDYRRFAERELEERIVPRYPPHTRLANVVLSALDQAAAGQAAEHAAGWSRETISAQKADVELVGPAPCPIERIRGRWRWHFLLRGDSARALGEVCAELQYRYVPPSGKAELRIVLDRDPVTLL